MSTNYNIQYNIPRVRVQFPGRQNRLSDGQFRVTPSMTEPVKFIFGNQDGVLLHLHPFKVHFVVWASTPTESHGIGMGSSEILINKQLRIDDPYSSEVEMILEEPETILLGNRAPGNRLYWSLFMVNDEGQVFPAQVSMTGGRFGTIILDLASSMPIAEMIRNPIG